MVVYTKDFLFTKCDFTVFKVTMLMNVELIFNCKLRRRCKYDKVNGLPSQLTFMTILLLLLYLKRSKLLWAKRIQKNITLFSLSCLFWGQNFVRGRLAVNMFDHEKRRSVNPLADEIDKSVYSWFDLIFPALDCSESSAIWLLAVSREHGVTTFLLDILIKKSPKPHKRLHILWILAPHCIFTTYEFNICGIYY